MPQEYETIQAAINAAVANDVILVKEGGYTENIEVTSNIEIRGFQTAKVLLVPAESGPLITVAGDTGFKLRNVTLRNPGSGNEISEVINASGIHISNSTNIEIVNVVLDMGVNASGIIVTDASTVDIINNTFIDNSLELEGATDAATIQNNIFSFGKPIVNPSNLSTDITFNCFANVTDVVGTNTSDGSVLFVDVENNDFHLKAGSVCINKGTGIDAFDGSTADTGAYGGQFSDAKPFEVGGLSMTDVTLENSTEYNVSVSWTANESYLVGGYKLYYDSDQPGEPYNGQDANNDVDILLPSPISTGISATTITLYNLRVPDVTPAVPELVTVLPRNKSLHISWSAVEGATSYQIEYGVTSSDEESVEVGDVSEYVLEGLENDVTYLVTVKALKKARYYMAVRAVDKNNSANESDFSREQEVEMGPFQESLASEEVSGTPSIIEAYPNLPNQSDSRCFIATAAYGAYTEPQVQILRQFRDQYLLNNYPGRQFVAWYYENGMRAAKIVEQNEIVKFSVRVLLLPLIGFAWVATQGVLNLWLVMIGIIMALILGKRFINVRSARCVH